MSASREYVFVDEWDVAAPREAVFEAIADARSYPTWWKPVYLDVEHVKRRAHPRLLQQN